MIIKLPKFRVSPFSRKDWNDDRIPIFETAFNEFGKEGFEFVKIYWLEGLALFKREIEY